MKIAVPTRHRRLLVLCACSAAVHLALLHLMAAHDPPPAAAPAPGELSVRLAPSRPASARSPASPATAVATVARAAPVAPSPPAHAAAAAEAAVTTPAPDPARVDAVPAATAAAAPAVSAAAAPSEPGPPPMLMPGRYQVRLPPPVLLTYDVTRQAAGGVPAAAGTAQLAWRTDGTRYRLDVDGAPGRLHSEGAAGDAGIVPRRASEDLDGATLVTEFDGDEGRVLFRAAGTDAPDSVGIQDRASLLMQLAGMGLANPEQMVGTIEIVVAGARDLRVARLQVLGMEDVATGTGMLAAWHLAERAAPGQARLDVWLAPAQGWLPVRIRVEDGGAGVTQTLRAVAPAPTLPAPAT